MENELDSRSDFTDSSHPAATLACPVAREMFNLGLHRLADQAVQELGDHLDACPSCRREFELLYPNAGAEGPTAPSTTTGPASLMDRLIDEVLALAEADRMRAPTLSLLRGGRSDTTNTGSLAEYEGQLAPDQLLKGRSYKFVVTRRIGFDDFTETYIAQPLPWTEGAGATLHGRAVIKIPRIADDMSAEAACERLRLLRSLVRVHAQELESLAGVPEVAQIVDCGDYLHRLQDRSVDSSFVAYEYVDGVDLREYMAERYAPNRQFQGVPTAAVFADWARTLTQGVLEIHNRLALHGDICPRNVLMTQDRGPVFIDVGQSLFREVMTSSPAFSGSFYRAPEGIGNPSSDIFSLGGLLYFVATGKDPIGFAFTDKELLKQQITLKIHEANPRLYQDDAGVADIIAICLRKDGRVQHASRLLRDIDTFWPQTTARTLHDEFALAAESAAALSTSGNSVYVSLASAQIKAVRRMLSDMNNGIFDVSGSATDIRSAAYALLGTLRAGDEFLTVSIPAFWQPENIGINGRFLSMCRNAAARGASVRRVFLITEDLSDPYIEQIVAAQLNAVADLSPQLRPNLAVRYLTLTPERRHRLVASGKHFGLLVKGGERIAMSPVYDATGALATVRFRSGLPHVAGLREAFDAIWRDARPLVDLRLPTDGVNLRAIERIG